MSQHEDGRRAAGRQLRKVLRTLVDQGGAPALLPVVRNQRDDMQVD